MGTELTITAETQTSKPQQVVRITQEVDDGAFSGTYYLDNQNLYVTTPRQNVLGPIKFAELSGLVKFLIRVYAEFKPGEANG